MLGSEKSGVPVGSTSAMERAPVDLASLRDKLDIDGIGEDGTTRRWSAYAVVRPQ